MEPCFPEALCAFPAEQGIWAGFCWSAGPRYPCVSGSGWLHAPWGGRWKTSLLALAVALQLGASPYNPHRLLVPPVHTLPSLCLSSSPGSFQGFGPLPLKTRIGTLSRNVPPAGQGGNSGGTGMQVSVRGRRYNLCCWRFIFLLILIITCLLIRETETQWTYGKLPGVPRPVNDKTRIRVVTSVIPVSMCALPSVSAPSSYAQL